MRMLFLILTFSLSVYAQAQIDRDFFLIARNTGAKTLADSSVIRVMGFAEDLGTHPNVPGPTLIVNEGDSVEIDMWNVSQGAPHTIHLHGLDVDQANDGVPHLSFEVEHMDHGFYRFQAPHPGTYLYHCHVVSTIHVQAGMYGMIIVKEKNGEKKTWTNGFDYDREFAFINSEIDTFWHQDSVLLHDYENHGMHGVPIPDYRPQFFLINGYSDQQLVEEDVKVYGAKDEQILVRLANVGFLGTSYHFPAELNARVISSDGRPLPGVLEMDSIVILPGERYQILFNASDVLTDSILVNYFSLNNFELKGQQKLEVNIVETAADLILPTPEFKLFPNPNSGALSVQLNGLNGAVVLKIYDIQGRLVLQEWHNTSKSNLIFTQLPLPNGLYVVEITNTSGIRLQDKLMLAR